MGKTVLVVEDNAETRDIWFTILDAHGYRVVQAENGVEGVRLARLEMPDAILMDYSLPQMDGWEATRRIRSEPATRSIPVIGVTAHAYVADRENALRAGCTDFLAKPCEPADILNAVRRATADPSAQP